MDMVPGVLCVFSRRLLFLFALSTSSVLSLAPRQNAVSLGNHLFNCNLVLGFMSTVLLSGCVPEDCVFVYVKARGKSSAANFSDMRNRLGLALADIYKSPSSVLVSISGLLLFNHIS